MYHTRGKRGVYFRHFINDIVRHDIQGCVTFDPHGDVDLQQQFGLTVPLSLQEFRFAPRRMYSSGERICATKAERTKTWRLSFNLLLDEVNDIAEHENMRYKLFSPEDETSAVMFEAEAELALAEADLENVDLDCSLFIPSPEVDRSAPKTDHRDQRDDNNNNGDSNNVEVATIDDVSKAADGESNPDQESAVAELELPNADGEGENDNDNEDFPSPENFPSHDDEELPSQEDDNNNNSMKVTPATPTTRNTPVITGRPRFQPQRERLQVGNRSIISITLLESCSEPLMCFFVRFYCVLAGCGHLLCL